MIAHSAAEAAKTAASGNGHSAVDELVRRGVVSDVEILRFLASDAGMEMQETVGPVSEAALAMVPKADAIRHGVVPVDFQNGVLRLAVSNPYDFETIEALQQRLSVEVSCVAVPKRRIEEAIAQHYGGTASSAVTVEDIPQMEAVGEGDAPIIQMVNEIILEAHRLRASDIHLEPLEKRLRLRYRIDGVLQEMKDPPKKLQASLVSRLKIMSRMSIAERRLPQDGRIEIQGGGRRVDLRVSTIPTPHGESVVMRILDKSSLTLGLPELGFLSDDQAVMERLLGMADGIFLVTGPTGSGKTTTLYGCLHHLNKPDRKIITVEDPVEYQLSGINQVPVNEEVGMTFAAALRAMLRQAPNIIMVGEIRDMETASIAINASLTGHLVFSTLHTNDAPGAVTRLVDIGIKPFLVSSSVRAIMAQRLVRRICGNCREPYTPSEAEIRALNLTASQMEGANFSRGRGCEKCRGTGYKGRAGIFEIFQIDDEIRTMINDRQPLTAIRARARAQGMRTLREDGIRKVLVGMTTADEVISTTLGDKA
ncbi:MAG: GspE/PulE family protein [Verrucomicrobium sp.]|nr:GspE/PulE family protein [Verrucomicrobium sp.]